MYLSKASRWWNIWTGPNISWESDLSQMFQIFLKSKYLRWREICCQITSTWQLKEVGSQSSLSGQTKVDESQDLAREEKWRAERMICSPKHKFSPLWMRSCLTAKENEGGWKQGHWDLLSGIQPFVAWLGCCQEKSCSMGNVVEYNMNTAVDVDGVWRKVEPRKGVMKHRRLFC